MQIAIDSTQTKNVFERLVAKSDIRDTVTTVVEHFIMQSLAIKYDKRRTL